MQLHSSSGRWRLGLALSLLTVILWGILPIALTIILNRLDVYTVTWCRFLIAFTLLAVYLGALNQLPGWPQLRSADPGLLSVATLFLAINYLLFLQGLDQTSPANAQILIQLAPVFLALGGLMVFRERYNRYQWLGLAGTTLGFVLFFQDQLQTLVAAPRAYLQGSGLLVAAAAAWAIYALAQKQLLLKLSAAQIMVVIYGGSALLFGPLASPRDLLTLSSWEWAVLLFCGLNTLIAYGSFAEALEHWEASRVSAVLSLTPLMTLLFVFVTTWLWPTLLEPERITPMGWIGAISVVAGSCAIALGQRCQRIVKTPG
jgi:drug/metabolite transporter (DMT)-like permease